ncbi:MAG: hypothetical protein CFE27_06710 [Alphaproteobacteria bacterium PA1]|nr:MAG: hypothetical protein CFE27_06710 [Alphaproteobacteria bacterium PA1]
MNDPIKFHVIAYQEAEVWLAQGVEYDILARAESFDLLPKAFSEAIAKTIAISAEFDLAPLTGIKPAPAKFKAMLDASNIVQAVDPVRFGKTAPRLDITFAKVA